MRRIVPAALAFAVLVRVAVAAGDARLLDAAKAGRADVLRVLLRQHVDVNVREADGTTALHWIVRSDDVDSAGLLIRAGASVDATNRYGVTPLALAAANGSAQMIRLLLNHGADANAANPEGETALMTAAKTGEPESVMALLDAGADVNAREHWLGETALMWAAAENHADVTRILLDYGADIDARSMRQEFAPFRFNLATMVNTVLPRGHLTALMMAARQGAIDAERMLIERRANLNLTDPDGTSGLVIAIINGHYDAASLLLRHGADPNIADSAGMAAVYAIVDMNTQPAMINRPTRKASGTVTALALLKDLLEHKADPNAPLQTALLARYHNIGDNVLGAGSTPLMRAAKAVDVAAMRILLDAGANVRQANRANATALLFAAGLGRNRTGPETERAAIEAVRLCLDHGADINAVNSAGQTAVHVAVGQSDAILQLLADRGAKLDAKNSQGKTPLDLVLDNAPAGRDAPPRDVAVRETTAALLKRLIAQDYSGRRESSAR
jgi:ankyrin repeat protein